VNSIERAPVVMAAIDLTEGMEPLAAALRAAVQRVLRAEAGARLACVNVLRQSRIVPDEFVDDQGRNLHIRRLAELTRWARPLLLAPDRVTYHALESPDPGAALLEYARSNHVDHIVMGARGSSTLRRYLGSVSSKVVAEAPCTVTVVRLPDEASASPASADPQAPGEASR
jgi:nucleotide-binding universal stress UspA family protein